VREKRGCKVQPQQVVKIIRRSAKQEDRSPSTKLRTPERLMDSRPIAAGGSIANCALLSSSWSTMPPPFFLRSERSREQSMSSAGYEVRHQFFLYFVSVSIHSFCNDLQVIRTII
jgi:hypothetical protein